MIDVCISQKYLGIAGSLHLDWVQETSSLSGTEPKGGGGAYVKGEGAYASEYGN